ncbi:uncharacterized protein LOC131626952 [Vicia villosa]|uniref:uncharacterized protein LOC131626952 n=1 Tax=Vicia villosa TaxID=3911 RepID=UPI00273C8E1E|nr:uncharacterized protein LOC131626952 [Vicia villosa]
MGCGISTMNGNDTSPGRHHFKGRFRHQNIIVSPIAKNNDNMYNYETIKDDDDDDGNHEAIMREEGFNGNRLKDRKIMEDRSDQEERNERKQEKLKEDNGSNNKNNIGTNYEEGENNYKNRDEWFIGPGSPSFREYCNDYDTGYRSSIGDSNDYPQYGESTKNSSDEDSTKPVNGRSKEQEAEKKERKGRGGFRNAMHKGKGRGGKRNILNFGCYNSNTQSYAEDSFNKVVEKTT